MPQPAATPDWNRPRRRPTLAAKPIQIGDAAARSGVSAKMIRYYEAIGLLSRATRSEGNYRTYDANAVQTLRFIARARALGFAIDEIAQLLRLWTAPHRSSADVKAIANRHIAELDRRIAALQAMRVELQHLTDHCHGDQLPDCPILDDLAGGPTGNRQKAPMEAWEKRK